jgi:hypothetical protein
MRRVSRTFLIAMLPAAVLNMTSVAINPLFSALWAAITAALLTLARDWLLVFLTIDAETIPSTMVAISAPTMVEPACERRAFAHRFAAGAFGVVLLALALALARAGTAWRFVFIFEFSSLY